MITLKKIRQSPSMCGPACLVSLLDFYGIQKTEQELATLCNSSKKYGTSLQDMAQAAESLGFTVHAKEHGTWEELQELINNNTPVVVNWWSNFTEPADGHYSVAFNITDENISIMDPEIGDYRELLKQKFLESWHDIDPHTNKPVTAWYLYVKEN